MADTYNPDRTDNITFSRNTDRTESEKKAENSDLKNERNKFKSEKNQKQELAKKILVIGSSCVDIIIRVPHLPSTAEDIHPTGHSMALGGCAFNAASMIRLFSAPVTLLTPVGCGFYGEYAARELEKRGFPVPVHVPDKENGCCYCLVEPGGERTFLSCHGAEYLFDRAWLKDFPADSYDMAYVCGLEIEEPTGEELIACLEEHPRWELFYAPGPRGIFIERTRTERIFALHPVLHVNEDEATALSGADNVKDAAARLSARTENTVIVTLGSRGVYCHEKGGGTYTVPAATFDLPIVDTIGAGDAHIGAVMASLSLGFPLREALRQANIASSAVIRTAGASLTEEEFERMVTPSLSLT